MANRTSLFAKVIDRNDHPIAGARIDFFLGEIALGCCTTDASGACSTSVEGSAEAITAKVTVDGISKTAKADPVSGSYTFKFDEIARVPTRSSFVERHFPGLVGIAFLLLAIWLTFRFEEANLFQQRIILATFALAGGGVAAEIPGFLKVDLSLGTKVAIYAGGALGVFVILFFFAPAK